MKILIISYYWPPSGGSGVQRWMYFAKHLKELGIEPIVLTIDPKNAAYSAFDYSLNETVKDIKTYTTTGFQIVKLYSFLKSGKSSKAVPAGSFGDEKKSKFDKIAGYIRANYFIPDARISWNKQAIKLAKKIIISEKIDTIITTGPPHSTHLIGIRLKKEFSIKWIADFRDPWTDVFYYNLFNRTKKSEKEDAELEKKVIDECDIVLTVGPSLKELLLKKTDKDPSKFNFIYNGFEDSEKYHLKKELKSTNKILLSYIGTLKNNYPYENFVHALSIICKNSEFDITLKLIGNIDKEVIQQFHNIQNLKVDVLGLVNHQEATDYMINATHLLLFFPSFNDSKIMITGKAFEYLATGNPILAIGDPTCDGANLLKTNSNTITVASSNTEMIQKSIIKLIEYTPINPDDNKALSLFSKSECSKQLVALITENKIGANFL